MCTTSASAIRAVLKKLREDERRQRCKRRQEVRREEREEREMKVSVNLGNNPWVLGYFYVVHKYAYEVT